jgi:hypothetical protein
VETRASGGGLRQNLQTANSLSPQLVHSQSDKTVIRDRSLIHNKIQHSVYLLSGSTGSRFVLTVSVLSDHPTLVFCIKVLFYLIASATLMALIASPIIAVRCKTRDTDAWIPEAESPKYGANQPTKCDSG